jgi:hypothetical protein
VPTLTVTKVRDSHQEIGGPMEEAPLKEQIQRLEERLEAFGRYL